MRECQLVDALAHGGEALFAALDGALNHILQSVALVERVALQDQEGQCNAGQAYGGVDPSCVPGKDGIDQVVIATLRVGDVAPVERTHDNEEQCNKVQNG